MKRPVLYVALALLLSAPGCPVELLLEDCATAGDEDENGAADCLDPVCASTIACRPEECDNNIDDNNDGATDCDDADCVNDLACAAFCGDNNAEGSETCDGADLNGQSCANFGFTGGQLQCNADCTANTSLCSDSVCGDGAIEAGEECEGADLGGADCVTEGFDSGVLACSGNCLFDTSGCISFGQEICDNNQDEDGDGQIDCADPDCANALDICIEDTCNDNISNDSAVDNLVDCNDPDCALDANCVVNPICGDGAVNQGSEQCDGNDFDGLSCQSFGFNTGSISCSGSCQVVTSGCSNVEVCNNGVDDNDGDGLADCADPDCVNAANCPRCGDGSVNQGSEQCDGADLGGQSCTSLGFTGGGTLACNGGCAFNTAGCFNVESCAVGSGDEDGDGLTNCADPDCVNDPSCIVNGDCASPFVAQGSNSGNTAANGASVHSSAGIGGCFVGLGQLEDVYAFTSPIAGNITISLTSASDLGLYVRNAGDAATCGNAQTEAACTDQFIGGGTEVVSGTIGAGGVIRIFVDGCEVACNPAGNTAGPYTLTIVVQ